MALPVTIARLASLMIQLSEVATVKLESILSCHGGYVNWQFA